MTFKTKDKFSPVRFAVCGLGYIGKRHIRLLHQLETANLVAVADCNPFLEAEASIYDVPFYTSLESLLLNHENIDVVNICTPNGSHAQLSQLALKHYCHVICEKPMALSTHECIQVLKAAEKYQKAFFCVMQNRYSPTAQWLNEIINTQKIGEIIFVEINCFWNRDHRYYQPNSWRGTLKWDGGPLFTQFSHFIDVLYWALGDIDIQTTFFDNYLHQENTEFEDTGSVFFNLKNGGRGALHYSTAVYDKNFESSITIIGNNGTIKIGGQYMNEVNYCHIKDYQMPTLTPSPLPNDYGGYQGSADNHLFVFQDVIRFLQESEQNHLTPSLIHTSNIQEGYKVVEIIENIYKTRPTFSRK